MHQIDMENSLPEGYIYISTYLYIFIYKTPSPKKLLAPNCEKSDLATQFSFSSFYLKQNYFTLPGSFLFFLFYFWLCWVFVSVRGLSPVAESGGHSSSRCAGLSLSRPLPLRSTGSRRAGSVVVAHGPSRCAACGIFPDQGANPCSLHWQADS